MENEVTDELRRGNYLKDLFLGLASIKFARNIRRMGRWFGSYPDTSVSVVNSHSNDRIIAALRERANSSMDHSLKSVLLNIADIFEKHG